MAEKLARLKREAFYDRGQGLQYSVPLTEAKAEVAPTPQVLRLRRHDHVREYDWIADARRNNQVAAISIQVEEQKNRVFVYPKGRRRFSLGAFNRMGQAGANLNGLAAVRLVRPGENLKTLTAELINIAERDASEVSTSDPEDWFDCNAGRRMDWLPGFGESHSDGRMDRWFSGLEDVDPVTRRDLNCYRAYLLSLPGAVLAHRTGMPESLSALRGREEPECVACLEANRHAFRIPTSEVSNEVLTDTEWLGWPDFHQRYPEAVGLTMLSAPGYSRDGKAFFSAFNRVDPRLSDRSNESASTEQYIEWVWLELDDQDWIVTKTCRLNSTPLDGEGPGGVWHRTELRREIQERLARRAPDGCATTLRFHSKLVRPVVGEECVITNKMLRVGGRCFLLAEIDSLELREGNAFALFVRGEVFEFQFEERAPEFGKEVLMGFDWHKHRRGCLSY